MYNNCVDCRYKRFDEILGCLDDEMDLDGDFVERHFCVMFMESDDRYVIPDDVWEGKTPCLHYAKR